MVLVTSNCDLLFRSETALSALIDGKNFNAGGHKVGLGFELDA